MDSLSILEPHEDVILLVFLELFENPFVLPLVCKKWNSLLKHNAHFWKRLCYRRWPSLTLLPSNFEPQTTHICFPRFFGDWIEKDDVDEDEDEVDRPAKQRKISCEATLWKNLFVSRHIKALSGSNCIRKAFQKYHASSAQSEGIDELLEVTTRVRRAISFLKGFSKHGNQKNPTIQFFLDSVLYSKVVLIEEFVNWDKLYVKTWRDMIKGSVMNVEGTAISFSLNFDTDYGGEYEWRTTRIQVGNFIYCDDPMDDSEKEEEFTSWLAQVRKLLGWQNATLPQVLKLVSRILVPKYYFLYEKWLKNQEYKEANRS